MSKVIEIIKKQKFTREDIISLLSLTSPEDIEVLRSEAEAMLLRECGDHVYYRGLIEFSNVCTSDCFYCGIRKGNDNVQRYMLTKDEMVSAAQWCANEGYGSVVLQSGERNDPAFVDFVEDVIGQIKKTTVSDLLPSGVGITLCVGEQSFESYKRFYDAGAHRYLLRIESSSLRIFGQIHPPSQSLETRKKCLQMLNEIGFQVGTGVMIGLPGQTIEDLADDILFFETMDIDMIGMGPYIVHSQTPMSGLAEIVASRKDEIFSLALKMIAVTRLALKNVNIAATTALQAMEPDGREQGLTFGANVIMPQLTPTEVRKDYLLYEGKPCLDENKEQCRNCLEIRIKSIGRKIGYNSWGDSKHAVEKLEP